MPALGSASPRARGCARLTERASARARTRALTSQNRKGRAEGVVRASRRPGRGAQPRSAAQHHAAQMLVCSRAVGVIYGWMWTGKRKLGKECDISEIRIKISTSLQFIRFPVDLSENKLNLANVGLLVKKVNNEFHESIYILSHLSCKLLIGTLVKNLYLKKKSYSMFVVALNSVK